MKLQMRGGFSIPVGETWIKLDIDVELTDKEIANPKLYRVEQNVDKGIKIINGLLEKHIDKQITAIKKMAEGGI